jgi:hypothetical protein
MLSSIGTNDELNQAETIFLANRKAQFLLNNHPDGNNYYVYVVDWRRPYSEYRVGPIYVNLIGKQA